MCIICMKSGIRTRGAGGQIRRRQSRRAAPTPPTPDALFCMIAHTEEITRWTPYALGVEQKYKKNGARSRNRVCRASRALETC